MIANAIPFNVTREILMQLKTPEMWEELIALGIEERLDEAQLEAMPRVVLEAYHAGKKLYAERQKNAPPPSSDNPPGLQRLIDRYGPDYPRQSAMEADLKRKYREYDETGVWPTWPLGGKTYGNGGSKPATETSETPE